MKNSVAIVIQNNVQFLSMKNFIDEMIKQKINVDIYIPDGNQFKNDFLDMFDDIDKKLQRLGYNVNRTIDKNKSYKISFEPYPILPIKSKYKIKYKYGAMSAKPNKVYALSESFLPYDVILCHNKKEQEILNIYSKTALISNIKFENFTKRSLKIKKPVLLYLPTYGTESSLDEIPLSVFKKLREKYYLIAKVHHGTNFLTNEENRRTKLKNVCDELYDSHRELNDLLEIADVVLSDNSGAIFEALYTKTPVAVFSKNLNQNKWGDFDTTQYLLAKEGILPSTNDPNEIPKILFSALSKSSIEKQHSWSEQNFYYTKNGRKEFMKLVNKYLNDEVDQRWTSLHREFNKKYRELLEKSTLTDQLRKENSALSVEIKKYRNAKLHRLSTKIYHLFGKE